VHHLISAKRLDDAARLFERDSWLQVRAQTQGFEQLLEDARLVISASLDAQRPDALVRTFVRVAQVQESSRALWQNGVAAGRIKTAETVDQVRGLVREIGNRHLPYSGFLGVLRLLDMNATAAARELLVDVSDRPWPTYVAEFSASALMSWSDFGTEPLVYFVTRSMAASPQRAARVVCRLYEALDHNVVPNRYTLWAAVLEAVVSVAAPAAQVIGAIDATESEILPGQTVLGYQRLYEARLKAIEFAAGAADPEWLGQHLHLTLKMFRMFRFDADKGTLLYAVITPLINHLVSLTERVENVDLLNTLKDTIATLRRSLETLPQKPQEPEFGDRSAVLARYARALYRLEHVQAGEAAELALEACDVDSRTNDPPRSAISEALTIIEEIKCCNFQVRTDEIRSRLGIEGARPVDSNGVWQPNIDVKDPFERGLAIMAGASRSFIPAPASKERVDEETAADCVRRALSAVWPRIGIPAALDRARTIQAGRSAESRELYEFDETGAMSVLANRMADRGLREAAAGLLAAGVDAELDRDEWTGALTLLSRLAILDPDAAEVRLKRFEDEDPVTGGSAVSAIIGHLLRRSDNDTLPGAQRWIRRLPHHDGQIGEDEALLLRFGGNCPDLTADLERISRRVINDCHEHLRVLSSPKSREREEIQSRWAHVAEALVLLGGFRRASERVRTA